VTPEIGMLVEWYKNATPEDRRSFLNEIDMIGHTGCCGGWLKQQFPGPFAKGFFSRENVFQITDAIWRYFGDCK
jgi:hypothetical protein